jgi:hypothetical protein
VYCEDHAAHVSSVWAQSRGLTLDLAAHELNTGVHRVTIRTKYNIIIPTELLNDQLREQIHSSEASNFQRVIKYPTFCGNRKFIICLQESTTCPHPQPDQSSPSPTILFLSDYFRVILSSISSSSKWSTFFCIFHQEHLRISVLPRATCCFISILLHVITL